MIFTEPRFLLFFLLVLTAYWSLRTNSQRKLLLLAASLYFYGSWDWRFLGLLLGLAIPRLDCRVRDSGLRGVAEDRCRTSARPKGQGLAVCKSRL